MASIVTDIAGRVVSTISAVGSFYTEINPSTLSGAIDVVVVEQESGELVCSPFHVRFGKLKLLRPSEKVVELSVNGVATNFVMKLGEAGEAFLLSSQRTPSHLNMPHRLFLLPLHHPKRLLRHLHLNQLLHPQHHQSIFPARLYLLMRVSTMSSSILALLPKSLGTIAETQSLGLPIASTRTGESEVKSNDTLSNMQDRLSDGGIELDNSRTLSVSPSNGWSWSWGDLPEKRQEQTNWRKGVDPAVMTHKEDHGDLSARPVSPTHGGDSVRTRASVPILNSTYYSRIDRSSTPRLASQNVSENSHAPTMSVTEKSEETPDAIPTSSCPIPATNAIPRIEMSICGGIKNLRMMSSAAADVAFKKHMVSFESFNENTAMMMDPALVFRIHGFYLTWSTIAPLLLAHAVYGKPFRRRAP
ncbi:hypothetical protein BASA83_002328 [Batrachochytrium salamandrivorans]|nr:hypothetical protein BASA83_002328 [Batrachochytrium salamandrivorans]